MTLRTAKLQGIVHPESENDVSIVVRFNDNTVYSGPASVGNDINDLDTYTVATWEFDASIHGVIPLSISVTGGNLTFANIYMNYVQISEFELNSAAEWPGAVPESVDELFNDAQTLSDEDFLQKYSFEKWAVRKKFVIEKLVGRNDIFDEVNVNTVESDGKNNVMIDGVPQYRNIIDPTQIGDWYYLIENGQTLTCDFDVLPPVLD